MDELLQFLGLQFLGFVALFRPSVDEEASSERYYYQQDGAPPHCARQCIDFLSKCFPDRVIAEDIPWHACSPDLSLLDFRFWGDMETVLREKKPQTVQQIQEIVTL